MSQTWKEKMKQDEASIYIAPPRTFCSRKGHKHGLHCGCEYLDDPGSCCFCGKRWSNRLDSKCYGWSPK